MELNIFKDELEKLDKEEKKLEMLQTRTSYELARVRDRKEAIRKLIEPETAKSDDGFEAFFSNLKGQLSDMDDNLIFNAPSHSNGHTPTDQSISRIPVNTKTFAALNAMAEAGNTGFTLGEIMALANKAQSEHALDDRSTYNLLNKQIKIGRIKRQGAKYVVTPKGLDWIKQAMGMESEGVQQDSI